MEQPVRVRFAPSPTGLLHLGSVRIALFNYIFARQKNGSFVLRIEDTDPERNFDPGARKILTDLAWLDLSYDEGPGKKGPYAPYFQSERTSIYRKHLDILINKGLVYRCFCTTEELEKKRSRQIALKQPPRYDRTCLKWSAGQIEQFLAQKKPFIWRFKIEDTKKISINDLARGSIEFDLSNFSDFPLTRENESFTFLFANAVDDITMHISYVFRGEDHISNTPCQALLYQAFQAQFPIFWHMPIICNIEGKKLSKRDFGFSLQDLKEAGYLPEAINNYLAIIGSSFEHEIMDVTTLIETIDFDHLASTSAIKYDVEKLTWVNHQWLMQYPVDLLLNHIKPFLIQKYPNANTLNEQTLKKLIAAIQPELKTLKDAPLLLNFYFEEPYVTHTHLEHLCNPSSLSLILSLLEKNLIDLDEPTKFYSNLALQAKEEKISMRELWCVLRTILTGSAQGMGIKELLAILPADVIQQRIMNVIGKQ